MFQIPRVDDVVTEDYLFDVGFSVAVGILVSPDVLHVGHAHQQLVAHRQNHAGQHQTVDVDGGFVHFAVAVGIFQPLNPAGGRVLARGAGVLHVGIHLGDVQSAVAIPGQRHGLLNHGFAGHQFDVVAGRQLYLLQAGLR